MDINSISDALKTTINAYTTSVLGTSWHSYCKIWALGHRNVVDLFVDPVIIQEKVDGCVSIDTPILKSDLSYVQAKDLKIGDKLIGFEDTLNNPKLIESEVTFSSPIQKECYKVILQDREVIASHDHPWLVRNKTSNNGKKWVLTRDLKPDMKIVSIDYWERESTWNSGYIAAFFDGEGSLVRSKNQRVLSVYQRTGKTLDHLLYLLSKDGFNFNVDYRKRKVNYKQCASVILRDGSWTKILHFLGRYGPVRLLDDAKKIWNNAPLNFVPNSKVIKIEDVGIQTVQGLSTSSKTYIAKGLFSHNSQFSFGVFNGELKCRSKGVVIQLGDPTSEGMFKQGIDTVRSIQDKLVDGYTYRGEYLQKAKHNALAYDRHPTGHIILFDINYGQEAYLPYDRVVKEGERLGLEVVPLLYEGMVSDPTQLLNLLERTSVLGGAKIEGFVIKNYFKFGDDKKVLMAKHVSEAFKEIHHKEWASANPTGKDILAMLGDKYGTPARWHKAITHLRDAGLLTDSPKDIGPLMKEVNADVLAECKEEIKEDLFKWAWSHIARRITSPLPQYYKDYLLKKQFDQPNEIEKGIEKQEVFSLIQELLNK